MSRSRTEALADRLRTQIADGALPPGQKLPSEAELITEHGVSRTVVREALGRLQAEGLIHTRRGAGSYALTPPPETTTSTIRPARTLEERLRLLEFRLAVETEGAALAAERRSEAQLAALHTELESFSDAEGNPSQTMHHDFRFHRLLTEASGNPFLLDALDGFGSAMITMPRERITGPPDVQGSATGRGHSPAGPTGTAALWQGAPDTRHTVHSSAATEETPSPPDPPAHRQAAQEHGEILAAVRDGDPRAAAAAMRVHLSASRRRLLLH